MKGFPVFLALAIYVILSYLPGMELIVLPVRVLSTFLHELGHAAFALLSGGHVHELNVNINGGGFTKSSGGNISWILIGGYVGSAIFGNILLRASMTDLYSSMALKMLAGYMALASIVWYQNIITTIVLLVFGIILFLISNTKIRSYFLSFFGIACLIHIIQDFNVGPTSDLEAYENTVGIFSAKIWMYIWLMLVIGITSTNVFLMTKKIKNEYLQNKGEEI